LIWFKRVVFVHLESFYTFEISGSKVDKGYGFLFIFAENEKIRKPLLLVRETV
jgi:hypothetical protein